MLNEVMSADYAKDEAIRMITSLREESVLAHGIDLSTWDVIVINTSAGKDSQAMMDYVCEIAREQGVMDRVIAVHADLGRVEWKGTRELAEEQCAHYGLKLHVVRREKGDLLTQIEEREMFPDSQNRYCTSDQKRDQISKVFTKIVAELGLGRQARILNCMGLRAEESAMRAKKSAMIVDSRNTNAKREVTTWLPIHHWLVGEVWNRIKLSGVRHHPAYDLGMPRLSCVFCIFAPKAALMIAGKANPELLTEYVRVEKKIGHTFRNGFRIEEIQEAIARGEQPGALTTWNM
jgi:3'-phosphoadenosine 5'-phosphosulfate sulfotransferase (PAPS reductase)/FAD synthetase